MPNNIGLGGIIIPVSVTLILIVVVAIVLVAVILSKYKPGKWESSNERRGRKGEEYINEILARAIDNTDAKLISGYIFQGNDITVQIDHLIINTNGVYVIETKNWSGYVYGSENDGKWTQVLANGNTKNQLRNPIKQNKGHIYQLSKILPHGTPFHNIVVMVQGNVENITADNVVSPKELVRAINRTNSSKSLTSAQIEKLYDILLKRAINGDGSEEQHIREINRMLVAVENKICPRCKGQLVIREGKYSKFYGCSNYPKCTFKKKFV